MEPFKIRSTPAHLKATSLTAMGLLFLVALVLVVEALLGVVRAVRGDASSAGQLLLVGGVALLAVFAVLISVPQVMVLRRYFGQDRGNQVVTFILDHEGWRWVQVGTDVLMPWAGLEARVVERTEEFNVVRLIHPAPVLVSDDVLSRQLLWNLKHPKHTDVPFTLTHPTEDELAAAIEAQSGGLVRLER